MAAAADRIRDAALESVALFVPSGVVAEEEMASGPTRGTDSDVLLEAVGDCAARPIATPDEYVRPSHGIGDGDPVALAAVMSEQAEMASHAVAGLPPRHDMPAAGNAEVQPGAQRALQGFIDKATWTTIVGWVWDPETPEKHIQIELVEGEAQLARTVASDNRPDLALSGIGDGRHAFHIELWPGLLSEGRHVLHLRCADTGAAVPGSPIVLEPSAAARWPAFRYSVDQIMDNEITGWIAVPNEPSRHCVVTLKEGGRILAQAVASQFREDLLSANIGDGCCAFSFRMPRSLLDGEEHLLEIVEEDAGFALTEAPIRWRSATGIAEAALTGIGGGMRDPSADSVARRPDSETERPPMALRQDETSGAQENEGHQVRTKPPGPDEATRSGQRYEDRSGVMSVAENDIRSLSQKFSDNRPWFYFDKDFYLAQCIERGVLPPLDSTDSCLRHYLDRGTRLGLSPNPLFDEDYYRRRHPDVAREIQSGRWISGFDHFLHVGAAADFSPTWIFDGGFYKSIYLDLSDENLRFGHFSDRYAHYLVIGLTERRSAHWAVHALRTIKEDFDFPTDQAQLSALMSDGSRMPEVFKPVFDYEWMKEKYDWGRSVRPGGFIRYYLLNVKAQRLSPSPYFDELYYLSIESDIQAAVDGGVFVSGYEHFLLYGMNEWRRPLAAFDPHYYFEINIAPEQGEVSSAPPQSPFTHFLRHHQTRRLPISQPLATLDIPEDMGKGLYERRCTLNAAHLGGLDFSPPGIEPDVSILIIARNNYELTANCVVSAAYNTKASIEVIIFDNASTDDTRNLPSINPQVKYLRVEKNLGFTIAVNRAAEIATGRMIMLLNNDIELAPRAIDIALETLEADRSIGAVGAKIVRMHGRLQEGGSIIWRDGSCLGYGRDSDPLDGQASFVREVDFCSGAFLATMRSDWNEMGGFDEAYAPAYYEETDFCVRVWERGQRVVYDPRIVVWHFEYGSSSLREEPLALMRRNQRQFVSKHRAFLSECLPSSPAHIERARLRHVSGPRTLFIEDMLPDPTKGMGFVRSAAVARVLEQACGLVSVMGLHNKRWPTALPGDHSGRHVEILTNININNIDKFLRDRVGTYDILWLSRTHNLPRLKEWRSTCPEFFANLRIVLDTEAISATRRFAYAQQTRQPANLAEMVLEEMEHLDGIDHICVVNELDRKLLLEMLDRRGLHLPVSVLGHSLSVLPTLPSFAETTDIVLAGAYSEPDSPNADGLLWFDRAVRPLIPDLPELQFVIAGSEAARFAKAAGLRHDYRIISNPPNMADVYRTARVMVAPTRFAAGVPMKVHEAASFGVPVVMTELLANQLGWRRSGIAVAPAVPELMAAAIRKLSLDPDAWHRSQALQSALVAEDCDSAAFDATIRRIIASPATAINVVRMHTDREKDRKRYGS